MGHPHDRDSQEFAVPAAAGGEAHPRPTPVRASLGDPQGDAKRPEAARTTAEFEADGASWSVHVGGKGRSGAASAPILLLVFERIRGGDPEMREAWVVGNSLADLTDLDVDGAFGRSMPTPVPWSQKPLFPEAGSRGGRDG